MPLTDNRDLEYDLAVLHANIGYAREMTSDRADALAEYATGRRILEKLTGVDDRRLALPDESVDRVVGTSIDQSNAEFLYQLALIRHRTGATLEAQTDSTGAFAEYRAGQVISKRLLDQHPSNWQAESLLALSLYATKGVLTIQGNRAGALEAVRAAGIIWERLANAHPDNVQLQYNLAVARNEFGGMYEAKGDFPNALQAYRAANAIMKRLVPRDQAGPSECRDDVLVRSQSAGLGGKGGPGAVGSRNPLWRAALIESYQGIGSVLKAQHDLDRALSAYQCAQAISEELADLATQGSTKALWQQMLLVSYSGIVGVLMEKGDLANAIKNNRKILYIQKEIVAQDPSNVVKKTALASIYNTIGVILREQGDQLRAIDEFTGALDILEPIAYQDPTNSTLWHNLAQTMNLLVDISNGLGRHIDAVRYSEKLVNVRRNQAIESAANKGSKLAEALGSLSWYYVLNRQFSEAKTAGEEVIADDFAALTKAGLENPTMIIIEKLMAKNSPADNQPEGPEPF